MSCPVPRCVVVKHGLLLLFCVLVSHGFSKYFVCGVVLGDEGEKRAQHFCLLLCLCYQPSFFSSSTSLPAGGKLYWAPSFDQMSLRSGPTTTSNAPVRGRPPSLPLTTASGNAARISFLAFSNAGV